MNEGEILLVEDNPDDAELTLMAFSEARIANPVVHVADGALALDYLFGRGEYAGRDAGKLPAFVLLDLNLPRVGGLDVLRAIREDARTARLPVVVLTSSNEEADRLAAYGDHANSYVRKPVDYESFLKAARDLGLYWLALNVPPPGPGRGRAA